jgi:hypothetical protein
MNSDVKLMCGVPETMRLYRSEGKFSDEASHFFPIISLLICLMSASIIQPNSNQSFGTK